MEVEAYFAASDIFIVRPLLPRIQVLSRTYVNAMPMPGAISPEAKQIDRLEEEAIDF